MVTIMNHATQLGTCHGSNLNKLATIMRVACCVRNGAFEVSRVLCDIYLKLLVIAVVKFKFCYN